MTVEGAIGDELTRKYFARVSYEYPTKNKGLTLLA